MKIIYFKDKNCKLDDIFSEVIIDGVKEKFVSKKVIDKYRNEGKRISKVKKLIKRLNRRENKRKGYDIWERIWLGI